MGLYCEDLNFFEFQHTAAAAIVAHLEELPLENLNFEMLNVLCIFSCICIQITYQFGNLIHSIPSKIVSLIHNNQCLQNLCILIYETWLILYIPNKSSAIEAKIIENFYGKTLH